MKKALAIFLCVVMLLPSFTFLTSADATITTWDQYAAEHDDYQVTQIAATQNAPTVDGFISNGEYSNTAGSWIDLTNFETDVPAVDDSTFFGTAPELNMYLNQDKTRIYFAFEIAYDASFNLNGEDEDFRVCISPQVDHNIPASYSNTTPNQIFLEFNGDGTAWAGGSQGGKLLNTQSTGRRDTENNKLYYEFSVLKSELERNYIGGKNMVGFTIGAWFYHYQKNTVRYGYGWEMIKDGTAAGTPVTRYSGYSGWDDQWLYIKLDPTVADLTYEDLAIATLPGGVLANEADYPFATLVPAGNAPKVDGVINASEYQLTQTYTDANITPRSGNYNGGKGVGEVSPADIKVSMNADASFIYFGVAVEFTGANTNCSTYTHLDMRFMVEPKQGDEATMCINAINNATKHQMTLRYDGTKATNGSTTFGAYAATVDADYVYFEFAVNKATLLTTYGLDPAKDIDYLLYGWWFNTYQDKTMQENSTTATRIGYGYNISSNLAAYTGWKAQSNANDWDDTYFTVKMGDGEATRPWFEVAQYGVPYATVAPMTKVPSVDGSVAANEYATKMSFTPEANACVGSGYGTLGSLEELPNIDVYVTSNQENIYMAVVADKTDLFNGDNINLVATFTDSASIRPIYNAKNPNFNGSGVNGTVADLWTNFDISSAADNNKNEGMGGGGSHSYLYPIVEWENTDGQDKYVVEIVLNKEIIKLAYGLNGDVETMHFGFWLHGITGYDTARICYGVSEAAKSAANTGTGMNVFPLNAGYDLDNATATLKFMDAGSAKKVDALNLAKFGQLKFYANNPTTAENLIDGIMSEGEYAFDYTFSKMRSGGTKAQWGVALGNASLAPDYAKIYMDYDAEDFYFAIRIKDTNLVPRNVTAGARYNYTEDGEGVKKPAETKVDSKAAYDIYQVQIAFNNNGSIVEAAKELEFQFYMTADINNDANGDGIAQANELTPSCAIKSLVGGKAAALPGMGSEWSVNGKKTYEGRWDSANEELVFEVKISKDVIAEAYGLDTLGNTISFRMNQYPWQFGSNQSFEDVAGTATDIATGGGGGNGLKVYTSYWDGTIWMNNTVNKASFDAVKAELIEKENAASGTYFSSFDYGHVVVLGEEMAATPVSTSDSASVRFNDGDTGMRFKSTVNKVYYDALVEKYGVDNVHFGTLITPKNYLDQATAFTKEALDLLPYNVKYLDVTTTKHYDETDTTYTFLGSIANIKFANYDREFAAIGYIEYTDGNKTYTVYSDTYAVRSVAEVAEKALNDFTTDASLACGYTVANTEIITGKTVYTPYTVAQRNIAKGFIA